MDIIKKKVEQVLRRLRFIIFLDELVTGLLISLIAICLYLSLDKFAHWLWEPWQVIGGLVILGILIGFLLFIRRRVTLFDAALCIDEKMQLKERITSALEFSSQLDKSPLIPILVEDAARHAEQVHPKNVLPFRLPKYFQYLTGLVVLAVVLGFVPYYHAEQRQAQLATIKVLKQEGKKLEELSKQLGDEEQGQNMKEFKETAKRLDEVGKALQQPKINEKEALAKLAKLTEELQKTQEKIPTEKGMQEALKEWIKANNSEAGKLGESLKNGKMEEAQAQLESLKQKMERGELSQEDMKQIGKDLGDMKESLKDSQLNGLKKSLDEMSQTMQKGDAKSAKTAMEHSQKEIEQLKKSFQEAAKMEKAMQGAEESKKQVAMAGQGSGEGEGEKEPGSGKGEGQGAGGKGKESVRVLAYGSGGGGEDAGKTSTNLEEKSNRTAQKNLPYYNRQSKDKPDRVSEFVRLYDPKYVDSKTYDTRVKGKMGEGQMVELGEVNGKPMPEKGFVPYSEIYKDSKQQAEDALDKEEVPAGYKEYVKNYFESIDPQNENANQ